MQLRTHPRLAKGINQLFSQTAQENGTIVISRHTYKMLLAAFICFALFAVTSFMPLPLSLRWLLQIVALVSFVVLLILIGRQPSSSHPSPMAGASATAAQQTNVEADDVGAAHLWQWVACLPVPVMITLEAQILAINDVGLQLTGWSTVADAVGRDAVEWLSSSEQREQLLQHLTATAQGTESSPVELSCHDSNAQPIQIDLRSLLVDFNGAPAILTMFLPRNTAKAVERWGHEKQRIAGHGNMALSNAVCAYDGPTFLINPLAVANRQSANRSPLFNQQLGLNFLYLDSSQRQVHTSQEHFRLLVEQSPVITYRCEWDDGPKLFYISPNVKHILGYTDLEMIADPTFGLSQCHPDDVAPLKGIIQASLATGAGQMEHRMRHKDGIYRWLLSQWRFLPNSNEYVGHILDITERKAIEEELARSRVQLRKLATRLNTVHEEERARMAREVHDVLGQNLTVLKFGLERMAIDLNGVESPLTPKINKLIGVVDQTVEHVQHLSAQLRPGVLDELGLASAIEWLVCEFTWQTEFMVELDLPDDLPPIEDNLAIVLYRIVQEALTNIVRHAKASQVKIALQVTAEKAILIIQDDGCGFDPNQKRVKKSLGLIGMHERIASWDGDVRIESKIGQGTTIQVEALLSPI